MMLAQVLVLKVKNVLWRFLKCFTSCWLESIIAIAKCHAEYFSNLVFSLMCIISFVVPRSMKMHNLSLQQETFIRLSSPNLTLAPLSFFFTNCQHCNCNCKLLPKPLSWQWPWVYSLSEGHNSVAGIFCTIRVPSRLTINTWYQIILLWVSWVSDKSGLAVFGLSFLLFFIWLSITCRQEDK